MLEQLWTLVLANPVLSGAGALTIAGGLVYKLKEIPDKVLHYLSSTFVCEVTINNLDASYIWIERWLTSHNYAKSMTRTLLKSWEIADESIDDHYAAPSSPSSKVKRKWALFPGFGTHLVWWRRYPLLISRESSTPVSSSRTGFSLETIRIRTFGTNPSKLKLIVEEAHKLVSEEEYKLAVYLWKSYWSKIEGKSPRGLNTVILKKGEKEKLIEDLNTFTSNEAWYKERGLPYRRGYLFSGTPGTGKTSLVLAMAVHLKRPLCVLNLGSLSSDTELFDAVIHAPQNGVVLIEDIDCASSSRERLNEPSTSSEDDAAIKGITKAGLLNALDGILTPENRIFVMTTNYPERLDSALIRPGRADYHLKFEALGEEQAEMASLFYGPNSSWRPLSVPVTPVMLQSAFLKFSDDPQKAREFLKDTLTKADTVAKQIFLKIFDIVGGSIWVASEDGQKVYDKLVEALQAGYSVNLSFAERKALIMAFLNSAIGQLYNGQYTDVFLRERLTFSDISDNDRALLEGAIENAKRYFSNPQSYDRAWQEVEEYELK